MAALVAGTALVGVAVVGPALNRAILWWVGHRVVVPALLGRSVDVDEVTSSPARCAGCGAVLECRAPWPGGRPGLLPWVTAGGRCRACGRTRPRWLVGVEAATGVGFGAAAARYGLAAELPVVLALVAGLVAVSAVDAAYLRIPTSFVHACGGVVAVAIAAAVVASVPLDAVAGAAVGAGLYGGFLAVCWIVAPAMLGFGDVRLGTLIGATVGWLAWSPEHPLAGPFVGVVHAVLVGLGIGIVVGTVLLIVRRANRPFALGPSLAMGALAVVLGAGLPPSP